MISFSQRLCVCLLFISNQKEESHPSAEYFTFDRQSLRSEKDSAKLKEPCSKSLGIFLAEKSRKSSMYTSAGTTTQGLFCQSSNGLKPNFIDVNRQEELESTITFLRRQAHELQKENMNLKAGKEEIENDKSSLLGYSQLLEDRIHIANTRFRELQKSNQVLITGITELKKENSFIRRRLVSIEEERDFDLAPVQRKFQRMLSDRDSEIRALKIAASNNIESRSRKSNELEKKFDQEREGYLAEIYKLKKMLKDKKDARGGYNEKLINVLETSQSSRNEETRQLRKEVKRLKRELNNKDHATDLKQDTCSTNDLSTLKEFLSSTQNNRNQLLLNIVASAKKVGVRNSVDRRYGHRMPQSLDSYESQIASKTTQLLKTVEELYTSESQWHAASIKLLENINNVQLNQKRSDSPKRRFQHAHHYD